MCVLTQYDVEYKIKSTQTKYNYDYNYISMIKSCLANKNNLCLMREVKL